MIPFVAGMIDRAIAWRTGRRWPEYLAQYRVMERWPRERLDAWRWERLQALLHHAVETVPYWREEFRRLGAEPQDFTSPDHLRLLPPLTKDVINLRGPDMYSNAPHRGRTTQTSTGGSTGRNVWLVIDGETHDRRRAAGRLSEEWDGVVPGRRMVTFWGASLDAHPSRGAQWYDRVMSRVFLSAYGVGEQELLGYFDRLARFRPEVITSYPSILLHAARRAGKDRCRKVGARLIYCSAEALYPPVREELEDLFGAKVRNRYASREFGLIASDCPHGAGLHVADMRLWIESGTPGADGPSELLITDLDNAPMPLIRYRIEDMGQFEAAPCPCGRTLSRLKSIDGRVLDVITTPDGRAFGGTFFTLVFRPFDKSIRQFQVVQDRADHLLIKIVPGDLFDGPRRRKLELVLRDQLGADMTVDLQEVVSIPPLPSGKRRFVVSEIAAPAADPASSTAPAGGTPAGS